MEFTKNTNQQVYFLLVAKMILYIVVTAFNHTIYFCNHQPLMCDKENIKKQAFWQLQYFWLKLYDLKYKSHLAVSIALYYSKTYP